MRFSQYDITSDYGTRTDPFTGETKTHKGVDYALPLNTEVQANQQGVVTYSGYDAGGYGNYVVVKDGTGRTHYYAHLNKSSVSVGDTIKVGDVLGLSGSTGRSTGPHLHYEVKDAEGNNLNPKESTFDYYNKNMSLENLGEFLKQDIENPTGFITDAYDSVTESLETAYNPFNKIKNIVFNLFKYLIIVILIVLFVVFITKALDLNII